MRSIVKRIVLIVALIWSCGAAAHEGHDHGGAEGKHVMGSVESIAGDHLKVKATDGNTVNVHVDDSTKYENSGGPGKLADLKVGAKVVVHGEPMKDGTLHAASIRFGKAGATSAPEHDHSEK